MREQDIFLSMAHTYKDSLTQEQVDGFKELLKDSVDKRALRIFNDNKPYDPWYEWFTNQKNN